MAGLNRVGMGRSPPQHRRPRSPSSVTSESHQQIDTPLAVASPRCSAENHFLRPAWRSNIIRIDTVAPVGLSSAPPRDAPRTAHPEPCRHRGRHRRARPGPQRLHRAGPARASRSSSGPSRVCWASARSPTCFAPEPSRAASPGLFELDDPATVQSISTTMDQPLEPGEELLIVRKLFASGRSSVSVNGQPATAAMVRQIGEALVDIHGQHDHQYLLRPSNQLEILDAFARCGEEREGVRGAI